MLDVERVEVESVAALRAWFEEHHAQETSIWLVTYKKAVREKYVSAAETLDEALCFGWMDGRRKKLDDRRTMQLFSPRKAQHWSKTYKDRIARLSEEGRMYTPGLRTVAAAKGSGMWDFMNDIDALVVPADLAEAFERAPAAWEHYEAFPDSTKRDILRWIKPAKKPQTRAVRIEKTVALAARNERASGTR